MSYNLRRHAATAELRELVARHPVDALTLQEGDGVRMPEEIGDLKLASATYKSELGLAIYYRKDRFTNEKTQTFALKKSLHDRVLTPAHERLIGTRLIDRVEDRELVVASFHAAPLTAMNSLRRNQIRTAHEELNLLGPGLPTLMVGDYNYPIFKRNLGNKINKSGYDLTLSDSRTYTRYKFFRGHFDLATSTGLTIDNVETLPQRTSDHMPILVTSTYTDESVHDTVRQSERRTVREFERSGSPVPEDFDI